MPITTAKVSTHNGIIMEILINVKNLSNHEPGLWTGILTIAVTINQPIQLSKELPAWLLWLGLQGPYDHYSISKFGERCCPSFLFRANIQIFINAADGRALNEELGGSGSGVEEWSSSLENSGEFPSDLAHLGLTPQDIVGEVTVGVNEDEVDIWDSPARSLDVVDYKFCMMFPFVFYKKDMELIVGREGSARQDLGKVVPDIHRWTQSCD